MEIPKKGDAVWQTAASDPRKRERRMGAVQDLSTSLGGKRACQDLAVPRASYYRQQPRGMCPPDAGRRCSSAPRLREGERAAVTARLPQKRLPGGSPAPG